MSFSYYVGFENNAEFECENNINKSFVTIPLNLDAQQTLANLRLSQTRRDEAAEVMADVYIKVRDMRAQTNSKSIVDDFSVEENLLG